MGMPLLHFDAAFAGSRDGDLMAVLVHNAGFAFQPGRLACGRSFHRVEIGGGQFVGVARPRTRKSS